MKADIKTEKLKISDMYLGKIDGYNEFLEYGEDACKGLFFEFPNIQISRLLDGSAYYIFGKKGTGKTMLLKYLESRVLENSDFTITEFIRFKRDIDAEERNQLKRTAVPNNSFEEVIEKEIPLDFSLDCSLAWQVYLIKNIVNRVSETEYGVFKRDDANWKQLCKLINALYGEDKLTAFKRIVPKMKRGNIELDVDILGRLAFEFESDDGEKITDNKKKVFNFNSIAKQIVTLYGNLQPVENKIYIFIDELELTLKRGKDYQRDVTLIRDLIFAIEYLNDTNRSKGYHVYIMAAIRSEVYREIVSKGMEINKTVADFGVTISWEKKGGNIREHPLLKMLEKRIHYSETSHGLEESPNIWETYFTGSIGESNIPIENYILDQTWYKPRDIIRLFTLIQKEYGDRAFFDQEVFQTVSKRYSEESWREFEETLSVKYSQCEVEGIRKAFIGLELPFSVQEFDTEIIRKAEHFKEVEELKRNRNTVDILKDMYEIGVIGNYGKTPRFSFKGDTDINPLKPLTIHYPLIRFFNASIIKHKRTPL